MLEKKEKRKGKKKIRNREKENKKQGKRKIKPPLFRVERLYNTRTP
jgi:hypothetical protein